MSADPEIDPLGRSGSDPPTDARRSLGARGEELACAHLVRRGYVIVDRNFRTRWGELDIIATDDRSLVFCEVKCRRMSRRWRDPLESVGANKRVRVRRMAGQWLAQNRHRPRVSEIRFDAIGVTVDADGRLLRLDHLEAAF
jgi:putative endonuclease